MDRIFAWTMIWLGWVHGLRRIETHGEVGDKGHVLSWLDVFTEATAFEGL